MKTNRVNNSRLYTLAQKMYVEEGLTAKAIASAIDVSEVTIGRWKKGKGENMIRWDDLRKNYLATPHNIKKLIEQELSNLTAGKEANLDMSAINKAIKAIKEVSDEVSVQVVYSVFKEFDNWMCQQEPSLAIKFVEFHKIFLLKKAQQDS